MEDEVRVEPANEEEDFLGIPVTKEGKAKWRARLRQLDAQWTPQKWEELRKKYGLS